MRKYLLFLFFIFLIFLSAKISALCEEGQIDINSASLEKLDELIGIGPVKAQAIIDSRPFESVDNLIDVIGIGEITLGKIKEQGLACVTNEKIDNEEEEKADEKKEEENKSEIIENKEEISENAIKKISEPKTIQVQTIKLNADTKDIKTEENKAFLSKNKLAIYGFITFCILLIVLFMFRKERNRKNEFR